MEHILFSGEQMMDDEAKIITATICYTVGGILSLSILWAILISYLGSGLSTVLVWGPLSLAAFTGGGRYLLNQRPSRGN
ncbi:hypothetical protein LCGC14_0479760 [marine sediment metagenome]|uniref:Uncharacterized protein n=1 Tax=marine sediment metagenome TaxID=412755 RepID=A0A0F9S9S9_9ZZZZ